MLSDLTSSTSAIHVSVYDRSREGEGFLGMLDIKPILKDSYTLDSWYKLGTRGDEVVTGEVWIQCTYHAIRVRPNTYFPHDQADSCPSEPCPPQTRGLRVPETHRKRNVRSCLPSPQEGHATDIRHEGALEKGDRREEGGSTYDRRAEDPAKIAGMPIPRWTEVLVPDGGRALLRDRL